MAPPDWVRQATRAARRAILATFAATALLAGVVAVERWTFDRYSVERLRAVKDAGRLTGEILLLDERLTMSARMATVTGESQWIDRYEADLAPMDLAIAAALALAPVPVAARLDSETKAANDALVAMERRVLELVRQGQRTAAAQVLDSAEYAAQKQVLAEGSGRFFTALQHAALTQLEALRLRSWTLLASLVAVALVGFAVLWRRLDGRLIRAEQAFRDKQQEVARLALHDPLTGLANRRQLHARLQVALAAAQREGHGLAVLLLDLDGFKPVNDRHGHGVGDAVLVEVSRRLKALVREDEIVARLGGDEFVVVIGSHPSSAVEGPEASMRLAQRLIASIAEPIELRDPALPVCVSASVGVAFCPADASEAEALLRMADVALYRAKAEARGEVRFFQKSMDDRQRERESLQLDLRDAVARGSIVPHFQPLVDLASGRLIGFEVLARWHHPLRGSVPPAVFIPVAEESGQIDALTVCVLRAALREARHWDPALSIAVNIAPRQLGDEALVARLLDVLHETGFAPQRLEVEITESALIGDLALARRIVLALKRHGIRVALDDFGTGYSSLSHLSELPFDKIKIDRSFVRTMHERPQSASIINAIVGLGRSLNLPTLAEGVESPADAQALRRMGCEMAQGFHFGHPLTPAQAIEYLQARPGAPRVPARDAAHDAPRDEPLARC